MKKTDLTTLKTVRAAANAVVARYMSEGYELCFGDSSFGYLFRVDLEKNGDFVRVKVERNYVSRLDDERFFCFVFTLTVVALTGADEFEGREPKVIESRAWYQIAELEGREHYNPVAGCPDVILTEDRAEALAINAKRVARWKAGAYVRSTVELKPTAALIRKLKSRKGFTNATRTTITCRAETNRDFDGKTEKSYVIELHARDGHVSRTERVKVGK